MLESTEVGGSNKKTLVSPNTDKGMLLGTRPKSIPANNEILLQPQASNPYSCDVQAVAETTKVYLLLELGDHAELLLEQQLAQ